MPQDLREGANVPLSVDTAKALADLRLAALEADRVRAALAGLPPPAASAAASTSPRLVPMPQAGLPGGRGGAALRKANARAVESLRATRREQEVLAGARSVHVPTGASQAASARAQAGSFLLVPGASEAAQQSAWGKHQARLGRSMDEGFKMESEGLRYGAIGIGREGVSLKAAWTRSLGPAMGYAAIAYASLKATEAASEYLFAAIDESARSGRPVGEVLSERMRDLPREAAGGIYGTLVSAAETFSKPLRSTLMGAAAGVALLADRPDLAGLASQKAAVASQQVEDAVAWLRGQPSRATRLASLESERNASISIAINESKRQAEKDAARVAEQLLRLGFPGSLDNLKGEVQGTIYNSHYVPELQALAREWDAKESQLRNGVQE